MYKAKLLTYAQAMAGEFQEADYQKFNMSLGKYMDSLEPAMCIK